MMERLRSRVLRAAGGSQGTLTGGLRQRRFEDIRSRFESIGRPMTILDVGGTEDYWRTVGIGGQEGTSITLLNLYPEDVTTPGMTSISGDATDLSRYADRSFDIVFSNSVIEHVGDLARQRTMANEVRRVGRRYYVQTPARYFPIEPHFFFPFFGILPIRLRAFLLRHLPLGWYARIPDRDESFRIARSIRLLSNREVAALFPDCTILREQVLGLVKSYSAVGGDW